MGRSAAAVVGEGMKIAFLFPGQGSQDVGMGKALAEASASAAAVWREADETLGFPLSRLCFEGPAEELALTANTQPAVLTASVAAAAALAERGLVPDLAAGHSLGEYSALVVAGAVPFAVAVKLVRKRGEFMQDAVPVGVGAMAALLGVDAAIAEEVCAESAQDEVVGVANINAPGQVVIAGHKAAVERAVRAAASRGGRKSVMLPVSAPFHSALMKPAADRLAAELAGVRGERTAHPRGEERGRRGDDVGRRGEAFPRAAGRKPGPMDRLRGAAPPRGRHGLFRGGAGARLDRTPQADPVRRAGPRGGGPGLAREGAGGRGGGRHRDRSEAPGRARRDRDGRQPRHRSRERPPAGRGRGLRGSLWARCGPPGGRDAGTREHGSPGPRRRGGRRQARGRRSADRGDAGALRTHRRAGQQCRDDPRPAARPHEGRGLGPGPGHEPAGRLPHDASGEQGDDAPARSGASSTSARRPEPWGTLAR